MLHDNPIIRIVSLFILPYIVLYALYIQVNGEVSPGGGFQAGAIFASAIIAFDLVSSSETTRKLFSLDSLAIAAAIGVLIYASTGLVSLLFGDNYLNYYSLAVDKHFAQSLGIFTIELGVGITVSSVMLLIYFLLRR